MTAIGGTAHIHKGNYLAVKADSRKERRAAQWQGQTVLPARAHVRDLGADLSVTKVEASQVLHQR